MSIAPTCRNETGRIRLERFAQTMHLALKQAAPCWDAWLRPEVLAAFVAWRAALDPNGWALAGEIANDLVAGGRRLEAHTLDAWHLDRRGYALR